MPENTTSEKPRMTVDTMVDAHYDEMVDDLGNAGNLLIDLIEVMDKQLTDSRKDGSPRRRESIALDLHTVTESLSLIEKVRGDIVDRETREAFTRSAIEFHAARSGEAA